MKVRITTRERKRQQYWSEITGVGAHVEIITNALAFVRQGALMDSGLPITVILPSTLKLRPGEIVDLSFQSGSPRERASRGDSAEAKSSPN